jgi:hypothetical protein
MDVQTMVDGSVATAPRAQLVERRGRPVIEIHRTPELDDALSSLAALGVRKLGCRFVLFDDGTGHTRLTCRRGAGRDKSALPAIEAARQRLGELLEAAIREAAEEFVGVDKEVRYDCEAIFRPSTGWWQLSGRGTAYAVDPEFFDVGLALD